MKFKANVPTTAPMSPRAELERKYKNCRANLLLVLIFTVINIFAATFTDTYFLFSATIPMLLPLGMSMLLNDPEYMAEMGLTAENATTLLIVGLVVGLILTIPYLLCWIFSKKRVGWMIAAMVFFGIDCLFLLTTFDLSMIADILIHAWVMFYLVTGVIHGNKLKHMPEDEPLPEIGVVSEDEAPAEDGFGTFNEADFTYTADNAEETAPAEETADEPVAARSFDEIMAENNEDGQ
jgi:hypothetical protein